MDILNGLRIVEFAGYGPGPFCAMMLADHGAEIIRIERASGIKTLNSGNDPIRRNRSRITIDLKRPEGRQVALDLIAASDALIEGHRPGVMERLRLGPAECWESNPRLVYGRTTGWGQHGRFASRPGRDINYIALSGALAAIGEERPLPPLNLVGDYGGGGILLAFGILAGVFHTKVHGQGQIVDAAMVDGACLQMTNIYGLLGNRQWKDRRQANILDGGSPFYRTYRCADGGWIAVGALDERSVKSLFDLLDIEGVEVSDASNEENWQTLANRFERLFMGHARDEWCERPAAAEACVSPVLSLTEAPTHPLNEERAAFRQEGGHWYPAPAPRFVKRQKASPGKRPRNVQGTDILIEILSYGKDEAADLAAKGIVK
jgi:alpha-methylacyl-CoA racemase